MIPNDFIQTLLARVDIVDVVDRYVPLKKAGANYHGLLPVPQRKITLLHRQPDEAVLPLLRLRRAWHRDRLPDRIRRQKLPRRGRGARPRARASWCPRVETAPATPTRREQALDLTAMTLKLRSSIAASLKEAPARDRLPEGARADGRNRRPVRHWLCARRLATAAAVFPRYDDAGAGDGRARHRGRRRQALRPFPRPDHVPDPRQPRAR